MSLLNYLVSIWTAEKSERFDLIEIKRSIFKKVNLFINFRVKPKMRFEEREQQCLRDSL